MTFLGDARQPEVELFALLGSVFEQILGQIFSLRVKTLSNTNLVASRHIKGEKSSLPVDMHRPKTLLLYELPDIANAASISR